MLDDLKIWFNAFGILLSQMNKIRKYYIDIFRVIYIYMRLLDLKEIQLKKYYSEICAWRIQLI